jgi:predicted amidohydrolase
MKNKLKFQLLKALAIIAILFEIALPATAAKYVTVATIGGKPEEMTNKQDMQKAVDYVIQFWQTRINQVLPDKPDLIVLPEGCDYPQGLSSAEKKEYRNVRKTQVKDFFSSVAKANHCYIAYGTVIERPEGGLSNTCIVLDRSGMVAGSYKRIFPPSAKCKAGLLPEPKLP